MSRAISTVMLTGLAAILSLAAIGCGGSGAEQGVLRAADSSWIQGERSLASYSEFLAIAERADNIAAQRLATRKRELALIEAAKVAAAKREKAARLRAYLEAKRRAEAAYRAALRRAALERKRQLAKLEALKRKRAEELRKLNGKLRVPPGEECSDPLIRTRFHCRAGRLPVKRR
jgi:hypothetical protein